MTTKESNESIKRRGAPKRPRNKPNEPRKVFVYCVHFANKIAEDIQCPTAIADTRVAEILEEAKTIFVQKYSVEPDVMSQPRAFRRDLEKPTTYISKPASKPDINFMDVEFSGKKGTAIHKGWNVQVRFIKGNDEAVWVAYGKHTEDPNKKHTKESTAVWISELEGLTEVG